MYSLDQVAKRLGLHVRTVRNYVRTGRLKARRIGKQYRVTREDLEDIAGPLPSSSAQDEIPRRRHVEVSSVIQIDAISQETADRVTTHLLGAAKANRDEDAPLRVETIYDEVRARMKVIVIGSLASAGYMFRLLTVVLEA
jgi:excisionase family DNA binding protein